MEITITIDELRKRKLFLGVPMYGGQCAGLFAKSLTDLASTMVQHGIDFRTYFLFNESLIPRARNYIVDEFMRSNSTHMLFIDADIGFDARDVLAMLALQGDETEYDVLAAPYPKKCISWEKIKYAVDKGVADENPNTLEKYVGDYVFNPKANSTSIRIDEPAEVSEAGTGFMMIRRKTFEKFKEHYPQYSYKPDHVRTEHFDGSREIMMYFQSEIDPKSKRYLSEDYWFCRKLEDIGCKIWLLPWMQTQHVGTYVFGGSLVDLAQVGLPATADSDMLKKNNRKG